MLHIRLQYQPLRLPPNANKLLALAAGQVYLPEVLAYIDTGRSFTPRTGTLKRSLALQETAADSVSVVSTTGYARYVESGSRAHVIRPRKAKALYLPGIGFRRYVKHPGSKPYPYILADMPHRYQRINEAVSAKLTELVQRS